MTTDPEELDWPSDEIEKLYEQAVHAADAIEWEIERVSEASPQNSGIDPESAENEVEPTSTSRVEQTDAEQEQTVSLGHSQSAEPDDISGTDSRVDTPERGHRLVPRQIIEAALFVGGNPLTGKKIGSLFQGEFDSDFIATTIDDLNQQYENENRPYEVHFGEGGYRLVLRSEYEAVRNRVFGLGPKEIKLTQESLEVLSLVAYQQPISKEQIERAGKENIGPVLRQLLRRELIAIERGHNDNEHICYRTTSRFLQVFGLSDLHELPRTEELNLK